MKAVALSIVLFSASALVMAFGELVKGPSPIKPVASVLPPSPLDPAWWSSESTNPPTAPSRLSALPGTDLLILSTNDIHQILESTNLTNWTVFKTFTTAIRRYQMPINRFEPHRFFTIVKTNSNQ